MHIGKQAFIKQLPNSRERFILGNGTGAFITHNIYNCNVRQEDNVFSISKCNPVNKIKLVSKIDEYLTIDKQRYLLSSQKFEDNKYNFYGVESQTSFSFDYLPKFNYLINNVEIKKTLVHVYMKKIVCIAYTIINHSENDVELNLIPQFCESELGSSEFTDNYIHQLIDGDLHVTNRETVVLNCDGDFHELEKHISPNMIFEEDKVDGRDYVGKSISFGEFKCSAKKKSKKTYYLTLSTKDEELISQKNRYFIDELMRQKKLEQHSDDKIIQKLSRSLDLYVVNRESTKGKTIIAGYPFFSDWGRDTFIAFNGTVLVIKRFDDAKSIIRSFIKYINRGLLPNMFTSDDEQSFYNTIDAPLLFINAVYEYYIHTEDIQFIRDEAYGAITEIIKYYMLGTDYNIKMDTDYLISGGSGLNQLTWMDIRFENEVPTPRHGKPVEINALWYNAINVLLEFNKIFEIESTDFQLVSKKIKENFNQQYVYNGYLKDVLNESSEETMIRPNQLMSISLPFPVCDVKYQKSVVDIVSSKLLTSMGMRTLDRDNPKYKGFYGDSHYARDMAYHQGTVWPYLFGDFAVAYLKAYEHDRRSVEFISSLLKNYLLSMESGCVGQICEVYDGDNPSVNKGCYAQAWSVAQVAKVYNYLTKIGGGRVEN